MSKFDEVANLYEEKQSELFELVNQILFEKNADQLMKPASMAKVMTSYIVFDRIKDKSLNMSDTFLVSDKAWRMGGSRSFLELNSNVTIKDLLLGLIVQSGNVSRLGYKILEDGSKIRILKKTNEESEIQ